MSQEIIIAIISATAIIFTAGGGVLGALIKGRMDNRSANVATEAAIKSAEVTASATMKASEDDAQDRLIDQLQEELNYYRKTNDNRAERLEDQISKLETRIDVLTDENRAYRSFIGVHRDLMAENGLTLPKWPDNLGR